MNQTSVSSLSASACHIGGQNSVNPGQILLVYGNIFFACHGTAGKKSQPLFEIRLGFPVKIHLAKSVRIMLSHFLDLKWGARVFVAYLVVSIRMETMFPRRPTAPMVAKRTPSHQYCQACMVAKSSSDREPQSRSRLRDGPNKSTPLWFELFIQWFLHMIISYPQLHSTVSKSGRSIQFIWMLALFKNINIKRFLHFTQTGNAAFSSKFFKMKRTSWLWDC